MQEQFDLLIRNATIVDGTGALRFDGDIGIRGDRIARIGDLAAERGQVELDADGRIVAPGFIDAHTHDDRVMLSAPGTDAADSATRDPAAQSAR
jgi:N-acyl-D-amino-acid deacylase